MTSTHATSGARTLASASLHWLLLLTTCHVTLGMQAVMTRMRVTSDIRHRYATTTMTTKMANPDNQAVKTVFKVTLPEQAFISNFTMLIDGVVYPGSVKEKAAAKKQYQKAVASGQSAGIVKAKPRQTNRFHVEVNVGARAKVEFTLVYEELLGRKRGVYEQKLLINPGQVVNDLEVVVNIEESRDLSLVKVLPFQSGNEILAGEWNPRDATLKVKRPTPNAATITFAPSAEKQRDGSYMRDGSKVLNGQLKVQYDVVRDLDGGDIQLDDGYFVHYFAPKGLKPLNKHVYFVLDRSGSMSGRKMEQLKEAMLVILDDLREDDTFNLLDFGSGYTLWMPTTGPVSARYDYYQSRLQTENLSISKPIPATHANVKKAKDYIRRLNVSGGTNIYDSLERALNDISSFSKSSSLLVFLTDGQANSGRYTETETIVVHISKLNRKKAAANDRQPANIYSLGFGAGVDFPFLKRLSLKNFGFARKIFDAVDAPLQMTGFYEEISSPLMSELNFEYLEGKVETATLTGFKFDHYFQGSEIVVAGRLKDRSDVSTFRARVRGNILDGAKEFTAEGTPDLTLAAPDKPKGRLERLWAYLTIKKLFKEEEKVDSKEEKAALKARCLSLALRYKFVTKLTSMVVTKPPPPKSEAKDVLDGGLLLDDAEVTKRSRYGGWSSGRSGGGAGRSGGGAGRSRGGGWLSSANRMSGRGGPQPQHAPPSLLSSASYYHYTSSSYSSFADSDPHFVVKLEGPDRHICFDLVGKVDRVYNLLEETQHVKLKTVGKIISAPTTTDGKKRSYFGIIGFQMLQENATIVVDPRTINVTFPAWGAEVVSFPWEELGVNGSSSLLIGGAEISRTEDEKLVFCYKNVSVVVIRHHQYVVQDGRKGKMHYLGIYLNEDGGLRGRRVKGLIGHFVGRTGRIDVARKRGRGRGHGRAQPKAKEGRLHFLGRTLRVVEGERLDSLHGQRLRCWFVPNGGKQLFAGVTNTFDVSKHSFL